MRYDAFISYSRRADGELAPALQRLARPWNRMRALEVFRDQTGLAVTPATRPPTLAYSSLYREFGQVRKPDSDGRRLYCLAVGRGVDWPLTKPRI